MSLHYLRPCFSDENEAFWLEFDTGEYQFRSLPKRARKKCGAKCRTGKPCKAPVVHGRNRCRMHGGLSTGPRTWEGIMRIVESNRRRRKTREPANQ